MGDEGTIMTADTWQQQLEELVALSSILDQDFRLLNSGGACEASSSSGFAAEESTPEDLLVSGPPSHPMPFEIEITVHVDTPAEGLHVMISTDHSSSNGGYDDSLCGGGNGSGGGGAGCSSSSSAAAGSSSAAGASSSSAAGGSSSAAGSGSNGAGAAAAASSSSHPTPDPEPPSDPSLIQFGKVVQHLPPLCLHLTLPAGYPNHAPPMVQLRAMWLRPWQVHQLLQALMSQWEADGPMPICFQWVEWLRSECLEMLGVRQAGYVVMGATPEEDAMHREQMAAGAAGAAAAGMSSLTPAFSGSLPAGEVPPEQLAISLVRYSANREAQLFQTRSCVCPICFDDVVGAKCVRLPDCGHFSCTACFTQYCKTQVADGAVDAIRCINPSCRAPVPPYVIQSVLTEEEHARWDQLLLQRTLDKMSDSVYCPRCNTNTLEDADHCARCPKCMYVFCGLCDCAWHTGSSCVQPHEVLERKRERLERSGNMSAEERHKVQMDLMGQYKSVTMVLSTSKQCPACRMAIQKSEGCNKMLCTNCGTKFCFSCLRAITDYDHFGANRCALFDMDEINRWNNAHNNERFVHVQAANFMAREARRQPNLGIRFAPCSTCGQVNVKEGQNNLMRCYACNSHFCYCCRAPLRYKPGSHFGPSRCKQHSDD